jgi:hypothetical protein
MFDDYKLFLQAKAEVFETNNKEKLEAMKEKLLLTKPKTMKSEHGNKMDNRTDNTANNNKQYYKPMENKGDKHVG